MNNKILTLQEAYDIIENCSAVIWGDDFLCYPSLCDLEGDDDNEWLYLKTEDDEGLIFATKFMEGNNRSIKLVGNSIFLEDIEGDEVQLTILNAYIPIDN